jgi:hypothetical protein
MVGKPFGLAWRGREKPPLLVGGSVGALSFLLTLLVSACSEEGCVHFAGCVDTTHVYVRTPNNVWLAGAYTFELEAPDGVHTCRFEHEGTVLLDEQRLESAYGRYGLVCRSDCKLNQVTFMVQ